MTDAGVECSSARRGLRDRRSARRRGFWLIELIVAIGLIGIAMNFGARLVAGMFRTAGEIETQERVASAAEQATALLRRDVERAGGVGQSTADGGAAVTLGGADADAVTWSAGGDALERRVGDRTQRFAPLPTPTVSAVDGVVTLRLGGAAWVLRPLLPPAVPGARR